MMIQEANRAAAAEEARLKREREFKESLYVMDEVSVVGSVHEDGILAQDAANMMLETWEKAVDQLYPVVPTFTPKSDVSVRSVSIYTDEGPERAGKRVAGRMIQDAVKVAARRIPKPILADQAFPDAMSALTSNEDDMS